MHYDVCYRKPVENGQAKSVWIKVGAAFPISKGQISMYLHSLPLQAFWDGKLVLFPHDDPEEGNTVPVRVIPEIP